jgi:hypothetical protein
LNRDLSQCNHHTRLIIVTHVSEPAVLDNSHYESLV